LSSHTDKLALLDLSPPQMKIWKEIEEINRGWFLLRSLVGIVAVLTLALICFLAYGKGPAAAAISAALDGVFGVCLVKITDYLYPNKITVGRVVSLFKK
jgi:hypothetical protein